MSHRFSFESILRCKDGTNECGGRAGGRGSFSGLGGLGSHIELYVSKGEGVGDGVCPADALFPGVKDLINTETSGCVSIEVASALMFWTTGMWVMDAWIFAWRLIHAALQRRGQMAVAVLTLTRWAQLSVDLFSSPVAMCFSGALCQAKRWR